MSLSSTGDLYASQFPSSQLQIHFLKGEDITLIRRIQAVQWLHTLTGLVMYDRKLMKFGLHFVAALAGYNGENGALRQGDTQRLIYAHEPVQVGLTQC